jgi:hypothetical protein
MFPPDPSSREKVVPDSAKISSEIQQRYPPDALQKFMERQEAEAQALELQNRNNENAQNVDSSSALSPRKSSRITSPRANISSGGMRNPVAPSLSSFLPHAIDADLPAWKTGAFHGGVTPTAFGEFDASKPVSRGDTVPPLSRGKSGLHLSPRPLKSWKGSYHQGGQEALFRYTHHTGAYQHISKFGPNRPAVGNPRGSVPASSSSSSSSKSKAGNKNNQDSDSDDEGEFMWTCCLSELEDGPGCVVAYDEPSTGL